MEKPEQFKTPGVDYRELNRVIENIKFEEEERVEYNGSISVLHILENSLDAYFIEGKEPNKYFLMMGDRLSADERKRLLFHEILEANLRDQKFDNKMAHHISLLEEEKNFGKRERR